MKIDIKILIQNTVSTLKVSALYWLIIHQRFQRSVKKSAF